LPAFMTHAVGANPGAGLGRHTWLALQPVAVMATPPQASPTDCQLGVVLVTVTGEGLQEPSETVVAPIVAERLQSAKLPELQSVADGPQNSCPPGASGDAVELAQGAVQSVGRGR